MKNIISILLSILLFVSSIYAQKKVTQHQVKQATTNKQEAASSPLMNQLDSISYAIGVLVTEQYLNQGIEKINADAVRRAINDVLQKRSMLINKEQAQIAVLKKTNPAVAQRVEKGLLFLSEKRKKPGIYKTSSGLQYEVIREGNGRKPISTDTVQVNYLGNLLDGSEFDNSYKRGQPISFPLSAVIAGWTEGLQLMTVGSKYRFFIPYNLAYGIMDRGTRIPGGSLLIFEIELITIK